MKNYNNQQRGGQDKTSELQTDISTRAERDRGITIPCTEKQYEEIIKTLWYGTYTIRKNRTVAVILQCQANVGLRIGDIMSLTLDSFIFDNGRFRFHMIESKTKKKRTFTVPTPVYNMLYRYAKANKIKSDERLFSMGIRNVQKKLAQVVDYLGYKYIGTHSFRKRFAQRAYDYTGDINLVRTLLQHADCTTTTRYLGISDDKVEKTLRKIVNIVEPYWDGDDANDGISSDDMAHTESNIHNMVGLRCDISRTILERMNSYCVFSGRTMTDVLDAALTEFLDQHGGMQDF